MNLLAIETSSHACSIALQTDQVYSRHEIIPRKHTEEILPMVHAILQEASCQLTDLDGITFGQGPGSFIGARLAASVAQGLAFTVELKVLTISSLRCYAQGLYREKGAKKVQVMIDAHMGDVYFGAYELHDGIMQLVGEEQAEPADQVVFPEGSCWIKTGDGWPDQKDVETWLPNAIDLLPIATKTFAKEAVSPEKALPIYLRGVKNWQKA